MRPHERRISGTRRARNTRDDITDVHDLAEKAAHRLRHRHRHRDDFNGGARDADVQPGARSDHRLPDTPAASVRAESMGVPETDDGAATGALDRARAAFAHFPFSRFFFFPRRFSNRSIEHRASSIVKLVEYKNS